jgi:hypothetical protein
MESYVELVHQRIEDRTANVLLNIEKFGDVQLRFTVRLFADCLDEETRQRLLGNYSEYLTSSEIRDFVKGFLPPYTEYALAELAEKKRDGERFDPPWLTQEEYQEMTVREKWPRIAANLKDVTPLQIRRELGKAGLLFRPYMLSDPGFNEGALEFAVYFDLVDRLGPVPAETLRYVAASVASLVEQAVSSGAGEECEDILRRIRMLVAKTAGLSLDPRSLVGPVMERYPREGPPGWKVRELGKTLETMSLKDLRLTAFVHMDLLTTEETREIVSPFVSRWPSFFDIPSRYLRELILAIADKVPERALTFFFERYSGGRMAMTKGADFYVWKLMPEEEKIERLREDNALMDQAMIARHLARYLMSGTTEDLIDAGRQIALLTDAKFPMNHGSILKTFGDEGGEALLRKLYDEVSILSLRMMESPEDDRPAFYRDIRELICASTGISPNNPGGGK